MACLLERDEVIFPVAESLAKRDRVLDNPWTRVRTHAMPVRGSVFEQELDMLLQRATAIVEVVDLDVDMLRIAKWHEFLFYRVPGKRVSDT